MFASLVVVGFLWGITNPFLKRGTEGVEHVRLEGGRLRRALEQAIFLLTSWKCVVPYVANQCGSVLYIYTLQSTDLTLAIPFSNSLSFVFTIVGGWLLGEEVPDRRTMVGMALVSVGTSCYVLDSFGPNSLPVGSPA